MTSGSVSEDILKKFGFIKKNSMYHISGNAEDEDKQKQEAIKNKIPQKISK